jgi:hypothetical protein
MKKKFLLQSFCNGIVLTLLEYFGTPFRHLKYYYTNALGKKVKYTDSYIYIVTQF